MRWRQVWNEELGKHEMVPVDAGAVRRDQSAGLIGMGEFEAFVSPVDQTLIRNEREYREHNLRNNVVNAAEFTPEFYEAKAKERARFYNRERTTQEIQRDRMAINETINRLEREHGN